MTDLTRRESEFLLYTAPDGAVKVGVGDRKKRWRAGLSALLAASRFP